MAIMANSGMGVCIGRKLIIGQTTLLGLKESHQMMDEENGYRVS